MSIDNIVEKGCTKCNKVKPFDSFYRSSKAKDGYYSSCKVCKNAQVNAARQRNPVGRARTHRLWKIRNYYNTTEQKISETLHVQNGRCMLCGALPEDCAHKTLHVDHDAKTQQFRGLLCGRCNTAIGLLADNVEILDRAIQYLQENQQHGGYRSNFEGLTKRLRDAGI
jgi:hypothetical protein